VTVALAAGAADGVPYAEADIAPWGDFGGGLGGGFEDRTVLPLDADEVVGASVGSCPTPFFCVQDYDHFAFGGLAPGTGFSITLDLLSDGYPPLPVLPAEAMLFRVYDDAGSTLFTGIHARLQAPLAFDGVVPDSGTIVVLALGPAAVDDIIPFTARYHVALDAQVIPEPATALLVGGGLAALGAVRRTRRRNG
jgi:hypothetical protein